MVEAWGFGTRDGARGLVKPFVVWSVCAEEYESVMLEKSGEVGEREEVGRRCVCLALVAGM